MPHLWNGFQLISIRMAKNEFCDKTGICENGIISMSQALDKEQIWVPERIWTDLSNTGRTLYPLDKQVDTGVFSDWTALFVFRVCTRAKIWTYIVYILHEIVAG